jgi:hypothetical protein
MRNMLSFFDFAQLSHSSRTLQFPSKIAIGRGESHFPAELLVKADKQTLRHSWSKNNAPETCVRAASIATPAAS